MKGFKLFLSILQVSNNWSKQEAWDKLEIELINAVGEGDLVPDDLEWVKDFFFMGRNHYRGSNKSF